MKIVIVTELRIHRKMLIIWSLILFLTAAFGGVEFQGLQGQMELLAGTVDNFPKVVRIAFGVDAFPIDTGRGGYASMFYWYQIVAFAFAVFLGVHVVCKDEREHTADFLFTKPLDRRTVLLSKALFVMLSNAIIALVTAVGTMFFLVPILHESDLWFHVVTSSIGMFLTQLIFSSIGILCAVITKSYRGALRLAFLKLIAAYVFAFIIEYRGDIGYLNFLTPVRYFNLYDMVNHGFSVFYVILTIAITVGCLVYALHQFRKRDLIG